jgi:3-phenylpropionate/trans-cinnamate dioxygenase ferredoxin reductase subunit
VTLAHENIMNQPTFVIVGAGQAGARAAMELRRQRFDGRIVLIGDEPHVPYERPPLSKQVLWNPDEQQPGILPRDFEREAGIELIAGVAVQALDLRAHALTLADGSRLSYDKLLLATGARARRLPLLDGLGAGVHTLRTLDEARALAASLRSARRVAIVGGGVIGLEVASSAVELGVTATVIEQADSVMARNAPTVLSRYLEDVHRERGVELLMGRRLVDARRDGDAFVLVLDDSTQVLAETVVYGVGAEPNMELARDAGLAVGNGIVVDANCRTSDADVFAAGDTACQWDALAGRHVRRETWESANRQAETAASAMLGHTPAPPGVPWFWTDQYGMNIQFAGDMHASMWIVRGTLDDPAFVLCGLQGETLTGAITVNRGQDMRSLKELIAMRAAVEPEVLTDGTQNLRALAKRLQETV